MLNDNIKSQSWPLYIHKRNHSGNQRVPNFIQQYQTTSAIIYMRSEILLKYMDSQPRFQRGGLKENGSVEFHQLTLESVVRMHLGSEKLEVFQSVAEAHALRAHHVSNNEAGRSRVTVVTVDENASAHSASVIDEPERLVEMRTNLCRRHVTDGDTFIDKLVGESVCDFSGHVEDVSDAEPL